MATPAQTGRIASLRIQLECSAIRSLELLGARFGPARTRPAHLRTGLRGENEALFFLRRQGYIVVARRWRCTEERGDLDLVAWEADTLCFVEVKARTARDAAPADSAVDRDKERSLRAMANAYMRRMPRQERGARIELLVRFDVVSVYLLPRGVECELQRDAFELRPVRPSRPR